jgi:hypothetical protein
MVERSSPRRAVVVLVVASGLWIGGCATTEAEDSGEPGIAYSVGAALGQVVSGFFTGFLAGWTGQPQEQSGYVYQSPTHSTGGYVQSYGRPVHTQPAHHRPQHHHRQ